MALETGTYINDLVTTNPVGVTDPKSQGDDHLRLIKSVLKNTFPGMVGVAWRIQSKNAAYTVVAGDNTTVIRCTVALTLTLTAAATLGNGHMFVVQAGSGDVTLDPNASEQINGAATVTVVSGNWAVVWCSGTDFRAIQLIPADGATVPGAMTWNGVQTFAATVSMNAAAINEADRVDVASATTVDLDAAVSNYVRVTGTTTIAAVTLSNGNRRQVVFGGALTLTNGSNLILPGGADIVTEAGDTCVVVGEAASVVRVIDYTRAAAAPSRGSNGRLSITRYYTSSNTWTKPSNLDFVVVEVVGGGSGGGSVNAEAVGGGGAAGGYAVKKIAAASLGATETVTIGAGGAANSAGGTSSFGAHCSATGGAAPPAGGAVAQGATGGVGSGGDLNLDGEDGGGGIIAGTAATSEPGIAGRGGSSRYGGGGRGAVVALDVGSGTGDNAGNYGSGGGGSVNLNAGGSAAGGTGSGGLVVVHEYVL